MSSSSEDEAPETVSRAASRAQLVAQQKDKRAFEQAERDSRKAKNRARAQQQQERTEQNSAAARMERAMRDAAEDNDHDEDEEDEGGDEAAGASDGMDDDDDDDEGSSSGSGDKEDGEASGDEHMNADDDDDDASNAESSESDDLQPLYLPDHLFKDALAAAQPQKPSSKPLSRVEKKRIKQKAKARRMKSKDVLLGDRAVRILPSSVQSASTAARRTIAPSSASTFVRKSLQLKKSERKRDWDRKTVDMGSSRSRHVPLHNFVRS